MDSLIHLSASLHPTDILLNGDSGPLTEISLTDRQHNSTTQQTPPQNLHALDQAQNKSTDAFDDGATVPSAGSTPTLLGIGYEYRMIILKHLLVNRKRRAIDKEQKIFGEVELEGPAQDINFVEYGSLARCRFPYLPRDADRQSTDGPTFIAGAQIIRVCRQLYNEGVPILYGYNIFVLHNCQYHDFSVQPHLTKLSTFLIKKLTVEMPFKSTDRIEARVQNYIRSLEAELPSLCELIWTSEFLYPHDESDEEPPHTMLEVGHRVMLCTAAYIALHHAILGTAIWDARSGLLSRDELSHKPPAYRQPRYRLAVRIRATNLPVRLNEHRRRYGLSLMVDVFTRVRTPSQAAPVSFVCLSPLLMTFSRISCSTVTPSPKSALQT